MTEPRTIDSDQTTTPMTEPRTVDGVYRGNGFHWVGNGFHVTQLFPAANDLGARISPFLLMDYHAPHHYPPTDQPRGVGVHPHRGFETVTLAFDGSLAHHDSSGGGGIIRPGDVQWMTAARGILHKEYHEPGWARTGGNMHMMQLWVNLPAAHKMDPPRYQPLTADAMGTVELARNAGTVTIIAGEYHGTRGPAETVTPINLWTADLNGGGTMELAFPATDNAAVFVLDGTIETNGVVATDHELVLFANHGEHITIQARTDTTILILNGEPIHEPVVAHGPFVMNTPDEIRTAINDFNSGRFGHLD